MANLTPSCPFLELGATISVFLKGTGTSWNGSTVFTVSGGSGATITGITIVDATHVAATLYAGTSTGTLTISDGTNSGTVLVFPTRTNEYAGNGWRIPTGSLTHWRTARDLHASLLVEPVVIGDSTTSDSGAQYSWVYRLRQVSFNAGFTDGGRGVTELADTAARSGPMDNLSSIYSQSGYNGTIDQFDYIDNGVVFKSIATGDVLVQQGNGRYCRLMYTSYRNTGQFTYQVDGGAPQMVDAYSSGASGKSLFTRSVWIDTGDTGDGLHQITITNTGSPVPAPSIVSLTVNNQAPGMATPSTKYYVVTFVTPSGETTASAVMTAAFLNSANDGCTINATVPFGQLTGISGINVYRGDSPSGPFGFIAFSSSSGGTLYTWTENGSLSPNMGVNPPTASTAGISTTAKENRVLCDFVKQKGIAYHKNARSGATHSSFDLTGALINNWRIHPAIGLVQQTTPLVEDAHPQFRDPPLVVSALGINDQQAIADLRDTSQVVTGMQQLAAWVTAANADLVFVIPHYLWAASPSTAQPFIDAGKQIAAYYNCAWCDFNQALTDAAYPPTNNPHIAQNGYNAEADYFWARVLSTNAPKHPDIPGADMAEVNYTVGDTGPDLRVVAVDGHKVPVSMADAVSAVFHMRPSESEADVITAMATIDSATTETINGKQYSVRALRYAWQSGQLNAGGTYFGKFVVTYTDGKIYTYPNTPNKLVIVVAPY